MRTLAARLGVRASSLYRHFPDRLSIERTLASRAAERLLDCMQQAAEGLSGEKAVFSAARAYLDYAVNESAFYDILIQCSTPVTKSTETTKQIWRFFTRLVSETTQRDEDVSGAGALWSFLHGFTVLSRSGLLGENTPGEAVPRAAFARGVQALVRGLSVADADAAHAQS